MLDICVVNYNTQSLLERFLQSLDRTDHTRWNLYIADNGSTDGSVEFLKENVGKYHAKHVCYNENIGFANACNQLAALGCSSFIGFFNADIWLNSGFPDHVLGMFYNHPEIAILGPKQRNEKGEVVHAGIFGSMAVPKHRGWKHFDPQDAYYKDLLPCVTVSGSAYLIRRNVWDELTSCPIYQEKFEANGAFLPTPHYYEETWCSYHAHAHGYEVWYDGTAGSIGHSWHASSAVGGAAERNFPVSQKMFREACDFHNIPHD